MASERSGEVVRGVLTLFQGVGAGLPDSELLRRFVARDDGAGPAFEVLVERHGPAVWRVCRRALPDPADALDAFQATFLILVQKASSVKVGDSLGPWLHGVSTRVARRSRGNLARRRGRERTNAVSLDRVAIEAEPLDDLLAVLDHELARLPARYRSPLMLCYLEGLTHEEAAARLSCPVGTVRSRLARGRSLLQSRLVRKGFTPSAVATAVGFETKPALAGVSAGILASTVKLALGKSPVGAVPAALVTEFGRSMILEKLGRAVAAVAFLLIASAAAIVAMTPRTIPETDDAPLPLMTVEQLAARIEEASTAYAKGVIETESEEEKIDDQLLLMGLSPNITLPPGFPEPPRRAKIDPARLRYEKLPSKSRHASDGLRWRASSSSTIGGMGERWRDEPKPWNRWVAGYDGKIHYKGDGFLRSVTLCETESGSNDLTAAAIFWHGKNRKSSLDEVLVPEAEITQKIVNGFRCYIVRSPRNSIGEAREAIISARQSYLPLTVTKTQDGEVELSSKLLDLRKLPDGRWYPGRVVVEKRVESDEKGQFLLESRRETRIVKFDPDAVFQPDEFALEIPWNANVLDRRTGLWYRKDPWWPELRDHLVREFDWPRADIEPLEALVSADPTLEGREAPPMAVGRWLRGGPIGWETLRGKVVLLVFSRPGDVAMIPSLRRLKEAYGRDLLEIVEVLPSNTNGDWAAGYLAEYDVDHPVLLDSPRAGDYGAMCAGFGAGKVLGQDVRDPDVLAPIAAYLIDPEGKVHVLPEKGWSKALVDQLRLSGSKTAKPLKPAEKLNLGPRFFPLLSAWQSWRKTAPSTGRIIGKVVDAEGKPIAGAKVRCWPFLVILESWKSTFKGTGSLVFERETGLDGAFVIESLCKGNYLIEYVAPGLATSQRDALLTPTLGDVDLKLVLARGDTVSGVVLDARGRPVAGARAELFGRIVDGEFGTTTQTIELAKSSAADAHGRFRFEGLWDGRYSLRITADGLTSQTRENVAAGASNLEFRLKPDQPEK